MTASKPKTPTASGISHLLAAAGFERSRSSASRIKGLRNHSDGYVVVSGYDAGVVIVQHAVISTRPLPRDLERIADMLGRYATAIEEAGFAVERESDRLIVTAKTED